MKRKYNRNHYKPFDFHGWRIEYSRFQKRWFVAEYDDELGWRDLTSKPTKLQAMLWCEHQMGVYLDQISDNDNRIIHA